MLAAMAVAGALAAAAGTLVGISIAGGTSSHHNGRTTTASSSDALNAKLNRARSGPQYSVRSTVTVGHEPLGVAVADGTVWVANSPLSGNHPNGTVSRINAATGTVIGRPIPVPNGPFQIAAGNGSVWVTTLDGQVTRINATTGAVVGHPILEYQQTGEIDTIDVADGTVWVANSPLSGERTVSRINASTGALIGHPIPLGSQPSTALKAGVLVVADAVLDVRVLAVATLDLGDVLVGLVGEDRLEAVAVMVGERELRAGVRALAPDDQSDPVAPGGQIDGVGDLRDLTVVAHGAVLVQRRNPGVLEDLEDRLPDRLGQLVADREAHVALTAVVDQPVRGAR